MKRSAPRPKPMYSSVPPERISHTTVTLEEEASSSRGVQLGEVPAVWLDRMLLISVDLPLESGEDAVVGVLVEKLFAIVPSFAIGVCLTKADGAAGAPKQAVWKQIPPADGERGPGSDPARLFPGYTHERAFEIVSHMAGCTLHIAGDDPALDDDRAPVLHLTRRAAIVLGHALRLARAAADLARAREDLAALKAHAMHADKLASFGQIAAGMVHELNNPLTSIVAYTDFLIKKAVSRGADSVDADDMERLRRISDSANRMLRFTRDLVTYARPAGDRTTPVVLHSVIDQALAFCEHTLLAAGAVVDRRYGADVLTVRAVPEQLVQVFVNLVTNACHAMPEGNGRLVIETRVVDGSAIEVVMEDNGHGIAPANLPHVFAPFFTTKGEGHGTGLGLSIVKNIVESHGGTVHAESQPKSTTRFVVRLPASPR